jgi:mRNA-degrading endonuclease YafQ of YafQ-DinJ toxin-antitoxin module
VAGAYRTLDFTPDFLADLVGPNFTDRDRRRVVRALGLLDENERHPSLRVHQLEGELAGTWSASASDDLRMTFLRTSGGRKLLLNCSRHYAR